MSDKLDKHQPPLVPGRQTIEEIQSNVNPHRGLRYSDIAVEFGKKYPIGSLLTPEEFVEWACDRPEPLMPHPLTTDKQSDAWLAHRQRRHILHYNINKAAMHPRMRESGVEPFTIEARSDADASKWEVRAPHVALMRSRLPQQVSSLMTTKRRKLRYLIESSDFRRLPPYERTLADSLYDQINRFEQRVNNEAAYLDEDFHRLESKIRLAVEEGEVIPINGGITGLLKFEPEDNDESISG